MQNIIYIYSTPTARNGSNLWTIKRERKRKSEERERREWGKEGVKTKDRRIM